MLFAFRGEYRARDILSPCTVLVVGDQDLLRTGGKPKSSKHLKAEGLAAKGQPIRFLAETDFMALVAE